MPLAEALRKGNGPCPICEPLDHQPEWAAFVTSHAAAIREEVRAKLAAEAAEKKRLADEAEAARLKRLADLEAERKNRETAAVPRLAEAQVRDLAKAALAEAAGDPLQFQTRFRARVREASPDYSGPQVVHGSAALRVLVAGPVGKFELAVMDQLQRKQTGPVVPWSPDVSVIVQPQTLESQDIKQVVVQRIDASRPSGGDATVLSSTLVPRRLSTAPSGPFFNTGEVVFPIATFDPGAGVSVRIIAAPSAGPALSRTFPSIALRSIQ
jgi:hypothetical protein